MLMNMNDHRYAFKCSTLSELLLQLAIDEVLITGLVS